MSGFVKVKDGHGNASWVSGDKAERATDPLVEATAKAACLVVEKDKRIAELEAAAEANYKNRQELRCSLKVMAEDRDEYRLALKNTYTQRHIEEQLDVMTRDELAVVRMFVDKVMGEGRTEYGPLDLGDGSRTFEDMMADAADEGLDREFYLHCAVVMRERGL
jgi:hypothetical protein